MSNIIRKSWPAGCHGAAVIFPVAEKDTVVCGDVVAWNGTTLVKAHAGLKLRPVGIVSLVHDDPQGSAAEVAIMGILETHEVEKVDTYGGGVVASETPGRLTQDWRGFPANHTVHMCGILIRDTYILWGTQTKIWM